MEVAFRLSAVRGKLAFASTGWRESVAEVARFPQNPPSESGGRAFLKQNAAPRRGTGAGA